MSTDKPETGAKNSSAERFAQSHDREILVDTDARSTRGAEYGKFMDDFYKATDKLIAEKRFHSTVGGALDLAQEAFLSAAKAHPDLRDKTGAQPYLTISGNGKEKDLTLSAEQLQNGPLSKNAKADRALNESSGVYVDVRFQRSARNFVDEQILSTTERTKPTTSLKNIGSEAPYFDMPPISEFMKAQK